jgi:DNA polymerase III sliding clamp (beta) subunit (PCNA family)
MARPMNPKTATFLKMFCAKKNNIVCIYTNSNFAMSKTTGFAYYRYYMGVITVKVKLFLQLLSNLKPEDVTYFIYGLLEAGIAQSMQ